MKKSNFLKFILIIGIFCFIIGISDIEFADYERTASNQLLEDGTYYISSAINSNIVFDVDDNSWKENANIAVWTKNNQNNQRFNITYLGDGYYKMEVVSSGKYLSKDDKDNVVQKEYDNLDSQKWYLKDAGNGYFYILSKSNSLYLDIYGGEASAGKNLALFSGHNGENQKFKFNKVTVIKGTKTIEDGSYNIFSSIDFNGVLDVHGGSSNNESYVEIFTRNNNANQKYTVKYTDDGYYKIIAEHSKKALTVYRSQTQEGANVVQYEDLGLDSQKWIIKQADNGYYIISKCNGLYLDIQGGILKPGANIEVFGANYKGWQKFKFYSTNIENKKTIEPGNYVITTAMDGNKALDVEGDIILDNTNIDIWDNNNGNNQKFVVTYLNDGYYTIKAFNSNKVLTVQNNQATSMANVVQKFYSNQDSQKWAIVTAGNDYYYLVSKSSGLVLDVQGGISKNGANLEIYEKTGGNNQKFKFTKTEFSRTIAEDNYAITAGSNENMVLDIEWAATNNGANVDLWTFNGNDNQRFAFKYVGNGYYTISALCSNKLLTVTGTNVIQQEDNGSDAQKWAVQKADSNGNYAIRNKSNDYYLDIYYNKMENGTNIEIFPGNDQYSQRFKIKQLIYKGIDVSKWQGDIDWRSVANQVDFAIIRAGIRGYGTGKIVDDAKFTKNMERALNNGIKCGAYIYSQAINWNEGVEEARFMIEKVKRYDIKYPIIIDVESTDAGGRADNISVKDRTEAVKGFCETIKNAGYTPMIYSNKSWLINALDLNQLSEYDVWLAHYTAGAPNKKTDYTGKYTMWQYTSSGQVSGINGGVDMDICYKKYYK